jgi:tripartite ATP-independent transporter DctM subunit
MTGLEIGMMGFAALFVLLLARMPVATTMLLVGAVGIFLIRPPAVLPVVAGEIFSESTNFSLTILPLFILMGNLAGVSGMSRDLYDAAHALFGHLRGGLASSTIVGCAGFSALSGSSLASALTMGRVALPEMKRYNYADSLATGAVAAGGTLGILIPPSAGFVVYAILTEVSIGRLFMAGVLPGILLTGLFIATIWGLTALKPHLAPKAAKAAPFGMRLRAVGRAFWISAIISVTIGGIYVGVFSAIEAAGIGAILAGLVALFRGRLGWGAIKQVLLSTLKSSGTVFFILFGAFVFKTFIAFTGIPFAMTTAITESGLSGLQVVLLILLLFIVLGTFLEGFAILVLTVPLAQPILQSFGIDMIWFGVLIVVVLEMALISPPVGLNVFVVKGIAPGVSMVTIFRGIWPFWLAMLVAVGIILMFPQIALYIPNSMFG